MPVCGMSNSWFRFKRFVVEQSDTAMKVGTDGVLLGGCCRALRVIWISVRERG